MKTLYKVAAVALLVVVGYFAFFYKTCNEPDEMIVQLTALQCAQALITPQLRVEVCQSLGRVDECEFTEADRDIINNVVITKIVTCVEEKLKSQGMCTDKVKGILR